MSELSCPSCGFEMRSESALNPTSEACPRCLAQSRGALSVSMERKRRTRAAKQPPLLARLSRLPVGILAARISPHVTPR
jgi:Zn-finger nucleic acid-binding protein